MDIQIKRFDFTPNSTIGLLTLDGTFQCFTLEDAMRDVKIAGQTAIPLGIYELTYRDEPSDMRRRYQKRYGDEHKMLWLRDIPDFTYVYFHVGNAPKDTEGCVLVGTSYNRSISDHIGASRDAYEDFYPQVYAALDKEELVSVSVTVL